MKKRSLAVKSTLVVSRIYAENLAYYQPKPGVLFPGWRGVSECLTRFAADKILRDTCKRVGLVGVSTHSFIRTALKMLFSRWHRQQNKLGKEWEQTKATKRLVVNYFNWI